MSFDKRATPSPPIIAKSAAADKGLMRVLLLYEDLTPFVNNQFIITRAGVGTKIIMLGDPNQIDNPLLDERTNGLSYAAEKMKNSPYCYQITMTPEECERSILAKDAALRM